jgi:hypothetical protein
MHARLLLQIGDRRIYVALLPLLRTARQQDQQCVPVAPEIDPVSRPEIDLVFQHALADGFYVGEIALYQIALPATYLRRYSGLVTAIQVFDLTHVYDAIIPAQHRVI